jgi:hypothetical protein
MSEEGLAWLSQPGLMWEAAMKDAAKKGFQTKNRRIHPSGIRRFKKGRTNYGRQELLMYHPPNTNSW